MTTKIGPREAALAAQRAALVEANKRLIDRTVEGRWPMVTRPKLVKSKAKSVGKIVTIKTRTHGK